MNRGQHLKQKYGITELRYEQMLEDQDGRCAICGTDDPGTQSGHFHIDHDHGCCPTRYTCGVCVRGLLCQRCNHGISKFDDDEQTMRAAASYVIRHRRKRTRAWLKSNPSILLSETLEAPTSASQSNSPAEK